MSTVKNQTYTVFVVDNFHNQDEDGPYKVGEFSSYEEAVALCKSIVDDFLEHALSESGAKTADELYQGYVSFGEDPFTTPIPANQARFSGRDYAMERCQILRAPTLPAK